MHILLLDNEPTLLVFHKEYHEAFNHTVTTACDNEDAWKQFILSPESFDIVITDHEMPEDFTVELASRIHKEGFHTLVI